MGVVAEAFLVRQQQQQQLQQNRGLPTTTASLGFFQFKNIVDNKNEKNDVVVIIDGDYWVINMFSSC